MNLNHVNYKQYENISQCINHPFGSMPRADNSLRKILFIQVAKVVSPSALACSSSCLRNSSVSLIWYCGDLFSFLSLDMVRTINYYLLHGNYHSKKVHKKQTPKSLSPLLSVLITTLLKRSKTMTNCNYIKPTFIFVAVRRADVNSKPQRLKITANTELEARAKLAKEFVLVFAGRINLQNTVKNNRTFSAISRDSMEVAHV